MAIGLEQQADRVRAPLLLVQSLAAGEIAPGRLADLIVLAADPLTLAPAEISNLAVDLTIVAGRPIYERGRPAIAQSDLANLNSP